MVLSQRKKCPPIRILADNLSSYFLYKAYVIADRNTLFTCISIALSFHVAFIFKDVYLKVTENTTLKIEEYQNERAMRHRQTLQVCGSVLSSVLALPSWLQDGDNRTDGQIDPAISRDRKD